MAKKRRKQERAAAKPKCSQTVAVGTQTWREGNHYLRPQPPKASTCRRIWDLLRAALSPQRHTSPRSRNAMRPRFVGQMSVLQREAQGKPGAAPASWRAKSKAKSAQVQQERPGLPCAMVLTAAPRSPRGPGLDCADIRAATTSSSFTIFAVASESARLYRRSGFGVFPP